jgi:histone acetyltransferase (RNA polymerase elongator complex component)
MLISVFIPHGGCPEHCRFCDQKVSGGTPISTKELDEHILNHLESFKKSEYFKKEEVEVCFYGGTFTALNPNLQIKYLDTVKKYLDEGSVDSVRISTRAEAIEEDWIIFLKNNYKLKVVEIGVQSFNKKSLESLDRSFSEEKLSLAVQVLKKLDIKVSLHLMIGLPFERIDEDLYTLKNILFLKPDYVRIHPLLVIEGTKIHKDFLEKKFEPITLDEAIKRASFLTKELELNNIKVIRLGLQPNELLKAKVVAGPYHPSFGELVRGNILYQELCEKLDNSLKGELLAEVQIYYPQSLDSKIKGQKKINLLKLATRYNISTDKIKMVNWPYYESKIRICYTNRSSQRREIEFIQSPYW